MTPSRALTILTGSATNNTTAMRAACNYRYRDGEGDRLQVRTVSYD